MIPVQLITNFLLAFNFILMSAILWFLLIFISRAPGENPFNWSPLIVLGFRKVMIVLMFQMKYFSLKCHISLPIHIDYISVVSLGKLLFFFPKKIYLINNEMIQSWKNRVERDPSHLDCFSDEEVKVWWYLINFSKSQS